MNIKYNELGEVVSVNGITTGKHLGAPMQDAIAEKPTDNEAYAEERGTVTKVYNTVDDAQPESGGTGGGGAEIKTCTVRFKSGTGATYYGLSHYSKYENGEVVLVSDTSAEEAQEFDFVFENVVCGSAIMFYWEVDDGGMGGGFEMREPNIVIEGSDTASQITGQYFEYVCSHMFVAPSEQGANCVITIDSTSQWGDL